MSSAETWIVNTGLAHHMTANLNALSQVTFFYGDEKIPVSSGEGLVIKYIGSPIISTHNHALILHDILHISMTTINFLSIKKLCKDDNYCFIVMM